MTNGRASRRAAFIVVCVCVIAIGAAESADAQSKCQALKYKAAGAVAKAKATCRARAAKAGLPVDQACITAADTALARKWDKAERQGDCVTTDDATGGVTATEQCLARIDDVIDPPPPPSSLCCNFDGWCGNGLDAAACTDVFGGTVGPAGSVCDAATGSCSLSPVGTGRCCMAADGSFCTAGPTLDLSGCTPPDFLDFPFSSTCAPTGSCTFP